MKTQHVPEDPDYMLAFLECKTQLSKELFAKSLLVKDLLRLLVYIILHMTYLLVGR